jgi:hypothetical protein
LYFHRKDRLFLLLNALVDLVVNATHPKSFSVNKEGLERQSSQLQCSSPIGARMLRMPF